MTVVALSIKDEHLDRVRSIVYASRLVGTISHYEIHHGETEHVVELTGIRSTITLLTNQLSTQFGASIVNPEA